MSSIINKIKRLSLNNLLFIIILIAYIIAWYLPPLGLPNFLEINDVTAYTTLLSIVAGSLANILGIIGAVLLVAFELNRKAFSNYAFREFFKVKELRYLFQIYIPTILFTVISVSTVQNSLTVRNLNLAYLSLLLFSISIIILLPLLKAILASTNSKDKISKIVNEINLQNIEELTKDYNIDEVTNFFTQIEANPIYCLNEISICNIRSGDKIITRIVVYESLNMLYKLLISHNGQMVEETIINGFIIIYKNSAFEAILQKDEGTLATIIDIIYKLHIFCLQKNIDY